MYACFRVCVCVGFWVILPQLYNHLCFLKCQVHKIITVLVIQHGKSQVLEVVGSVSWSSFRLFNVLDLHRLYQDYTSNEIMVASHLCTKVAPTGYQYSSLEACLFSCYILVYYWLVGHPVWEKAWAPRDFHTSEVIGGTFLFSFLSVWREPISAILELQQGDMTNIPSAMMYNWVLHNLLYLL
jgi:hypothetical protein